MNKTVTGIILIVVAAVAVWWAWGKLKPYVAPAPAAPPGMKPGDMMTSGTMVMKSVEWTEIQV
jgi:hypothetical protein